MNTPRRSDRLLAYSSMRPVYIIDGIKTLEQGKELLHGTMDDAGRLKG